MRSLAVSAARLMNLEGPDIIALAVAIILGVAASVYLPKGPWTGFISVFVSYHIFFIWLMVSADYEEGKKLPIAGAVLTHLACLAVVCGAAMGVRSIPYFRLITLLPGFSLLRFGFTAFALFERNWILTGARKRAAVAEAGPSVELLMATAEDHEAWMQYLATRNATRTVKAGTSIKAEHETWLRARFKARREAEARKRMADATERGEVNANAPLQT